MFARIVDKFQTLFTVQKLQLFLQKSQLQKFSNCSRSFSTNPKTSSDEHLWVKSAIDIQPVTSKTVPEFLWERVLQWGSAPAMTCGVSDQSYSYDQLYRNSRGFSAGLIKQGVNRGDVIGLVLQNTPDFPIALLGSLDAGCVVSTINPGYTAHEITRQLLSSEAKYVVTIDHFLPAVLKARESCPAINKIIVVGSSQPPEGCLAFYDLIKTDPKGFDFLKGSEIDPTTTTAVLPYSSGTSGPPKGVALTHCNLNSNVIQHIQPDVGTTASFGNGKSQERLLAVIPLFHIYGLHTFNFYGSYQGAHTMCLPKFEPASFANVMRKHRPTVLHLVPPLINFMCQSPEIGKDELASVHSIVAGAAPIGEVLINKLLEKAGKYIFFQEAHGMTELSPMALMLPPSTKNKKIGSCGKPVPSTIIKVVDLTGQTLGANQNGELCMRGPQVMKGYFKNEKATNDTIDPQGWLHTGDIGYYDADKCFFIVDRLKELIKVKGFQVAPSELEDLLREHEDVVDVAVIGIPDANAGELPRAYIVSKNKNIRAEDINEFIKDKVISYKRLKGGIEFVDIIPKAPSGKLLRRELLASYKQKHNL